MDIEIRHVEQSDYPNLFKIYSFASVTENTSQVPFLNSQKVAEFFEIPNSYNLVAVYQSKVVGHISLLLNAKSRAKHCADVAIAIHPDSQGKGIGKKLLQVAINQADNWLNLSRLELEVFEDNINAIGLYKSVGFVQEGVKKCASFKNGRYANLVIMARLKAH